MNLEPGHIVGNYEVVALLGEGGVGIVYRVRHRFLGTEHALKVLRQERLNSEFVRDRFLAEARIQAQLRHPGILTVTDLVSEPGVAGLLMDLVDGPSLAEAIEQRSAPPSPGEIRAVFVPILEAVGFAHAKGVIHRDLKPENILLDRDHNGNVRPRVGDFGIAKLVGELVGCGTSKRSTVADRALGTFGYMSPEQIRSAKQVDHRTDVFALGVTLLEFATLHNPFQRESDYETQHAIVTGAFEIPAALEARDPALTATICKALEVDPASRFQSCAEFESALARVTPIAKRGSSTGRRESAKTRKAEPRRAQDSRVVDDRWRDWAARDDSVRWKRVQIAPGITADRVWAVLGGEAPSWPQALLLYDDTQVASAGGGLVLFADRVMWRSVGVHGVRELALDRLRSATVGRSGEWWTVVLNGTETFYLRRPDAAGTARSLASAIECAAALSSSSLSSRIPDAGGAVRELESAGDDLATPTPRASGIAAIARGRVTLWRYITSQAIETLLGRAVSPLSNALLLYDDSSPSGVKAGLVIFADRVVWRSLGLAKVDEIRLDAIRSIAIRSTPEWSGIVFNGEQVFRLHQPNGKAFAERLASAIIEAKRADPSEQSWAASLVDLAAIEPEDPEPPLVELPTTILGAAAEPDEGSGVSVGMHQREAEGLPGRPITTMQTPARESVTPWGLAFIVTVMIFSPLIWDGIQSAQREPRGVSPQSAAASQQSAPPRSPTSNTTPPSSAAGMASVSAPVPTVARGATARIDRFRVVGDGTVIDTQTGLMWAATDNGSDIDWPGAKRYAESLTLAGHSDWRLPTQDELHGLYDESNPARAVSCSPDQKFPPHVPPGFTFTCLWYWASETRRSQAAFVYFYAGYRFFNPQKTSRFGRVLPVRDRTSRKSVGSSILPPS